MSAAFESAGLARESAGWTVRGTLCATVSFIWALVMGFNSPADIAGILAGLAAWIGLLTWFCVWYGMAPRDGEVRLVRALKIAAWIKFATSAAGGLMFLVFSLGPKDAIIDLGVVGVMPDCLLGLASISLVAGISGLQMEVLQRADSFGWTALITFVDGALFLLVIAALAVAVLLWWRFAPGVLAKLKFSPARLAG